LKAQAKQILDQGGDLGAIPYDTLAGMDQAGRTALTAYAKAGGRVASDPVVFYRLQNQALDDPQAFLDADLHDHLGNLDAKDFAALSQLQDKLRKNEDDPQLSLLRSYKANTDRVLAQLGLPVGASSDTAESDSGALQRAATFRRQVETDLSAYEAATGRKATPAEQQKIVDQAAINQRTSARHYAMTRFGGIVQLPGSAGDEMRSNGTPLLMQTASGDSQAMDSTGDTQVQEQDNKAGVSDERSDGSKPNNAPDDTVPLSAKPEAVNAPWRQEGAREKYGGVLPYPNGGLEPSYKGERKAIGPLSKKAEEAIWTLKPAEIWPVAGDHRLNTPASGGDGRFGTRTSQHKGIDITVKIGTPVVAVEDGEVVFAVTTIQGYVDGGYGNEVVIKHADGTYTQYAHLNPAVDANKAPIKNADGTERISVKRGDKVKAGQQIGESGKTGNAWETNEPHLHFEVRYGTDGLSKKNRTVINPMYLLP